MIPKYKHLYLLILVILLFGSSCQKKKTESGDQTNSLQITKLTELADRYNKDTKTDRAFYYFNKAKSITNPKKDFKKIAYCLLEMAQIQLDHGDYTGSQTTTTEAIQYIKKTDTAYLWTAYRMLARNNFCMHSYDKSIFYYQKAYQLKTDKKQKIVIQNQLGLVYREQKKYKEAIDVFESLLLIKDVQDKAVLLSGILDNLGSCYTLVNNSKALDFLQKALKIRLRLNDKAGLGLSYTNLSKFYNNSNPILAKKYALLSYKEYTEADCIDDRLNALELAIENSYEDDLKKSSILYIRLIDSIFEVRQKAKNHYARIKYDSKNEKVENLKLRTQKVQNELHLEKQKTRNMISYILIVLTLSLSLVLYFYLTSKVNKEKIEATYKSETRIAKKLHDELANDIYHTMAFAESRNLSLTENKDLLISNLDAIHLRTSDISKESGQIITNENYMYRLEEMIAGFNTPNINLLVNGLDLISRIDIEINRKIAIYRVLQELLVNMKKHSNATLIEINIKNKDKDILINYTDNGKGTDMTTLNLKNGLHLAKNRIINIKGEIETESAPDEGFKVSIKFPV